MAVKSIKTKADKILARVGIRSRAARLGGSVPGGCILLGRPENRNSNAGQSVSGGEGKHSSHGSGHGRGEGRGTDAREMVVGERRITGMRMESEFLRECL